MKKITIHDIRNNSDRIGLNIDYALGIYGDSPEKPKKPFLKNAHNADEALQYAADLRLWQEKMHDYEIALAAWRDRRNHAESVLVEYIKEEAGFSRVPTPYQDKIWSLAWADGHSYGYYEVYQKLSSLVEIFE
jgi:hypothetical protein